MNANIWIRDPYPFRHEEMQAIEEALRSTYGGSLVYLSEWPVHYVSADRVNSTVCKQIAATIKTIHKQWAIREKAVWGRVYCASLEVDIREDGRPDWAKAKEGDGRR